MSRQWAQLPERGTTAALTTIRWIGVHIGRWAGRLLLYPITLYFLLTAAEPRRGSRIYLGRVLRREPHWFEIFRHIHCFAITILDRVFLLNGQFDRFDLRVHNERVILNQAASGRGCILLGSHLGSFEVLRALGVMEQHLPVKVLMDIDHNPRISRFLGALSPKILETVIPMTGPGTVLRIKEHLDQGFLIGALADRAVASDRTVQCRFLGAETHFPAGPVLMAAALKCPVILFFGLYRGGNRYDIHFELFADPVPLDRDRRQQDLQEWVQRYACRLEHYARTAPYNWFNFYDFWNQDHADRQSGNP